MSILDDAIREHLELKRAHGADEAELKKLEDEAFGPPGRPEEPDSFAEAPTEFMTTPEAAEAAEPSGEGARRINIADLQEAPPPESELEEEPQLEAAAAIEPQAEETPIVPAEDAAQAAPPAEEPPVLEEAESSPAEERQAIAEQPTELFDIEAEMGTEDAPSIEAVAEEPLVEEEEEDEEFWSEQRLSDELDQALEAPPGEPTLTEAPLTEEQELLPPGAQAPAPPSDSVSPPAPAPAHPDAEDDEARPDYDPDTGHEDVLEDTPDFLEDAPEDDDLWFEQRPPKDFDFDD
jgi:hypothetical protein